MIKTKNKTKKNNKKNNNFLLSKTISTNNSIVTTEVNYTVPLYLANSTQNVSFQTGADIRYLTFNTALQTNTYPFADFSTVYDEFRINSAYLVASTYSNLALNLPPVHMTVDPDGPASNPTNLTVLNSSQGHIFMMGMVRPENITIKFSGVSNSAHVWLDVSATPTGAFYFGLNTTGLGGIGNTLILELNVMLSVSFRGIRGR